MTSRSPASHRGPAANGPDLSGATAARDQQACHQYLREHFDRLAPQALRWKRRNRGYHRMLEDHLRFLIPPGQRILEVGCGTGDLLAALQPAHGVGVDLSPAMIDLAREAHRGEEFHFHAVAIEDFAGDGETYDYIVLSDLVGFLYDIRAVFAHLAGFCHARTRLVINFHSRLWEPILTLAEAVGLKARQPVLNWVTREDVDSLLQLASFETVRAYGRIILPKRLGPISALANRVLAPFWPFSHLCVCNFVIARPLLPPVAAGSPPRVSVIVPCRNEAGNIPALVARVPEMGAGTELVFVEGGSEDDTHEQCLRAQAENPQRQIVVLQQTGQGKGDAVRLGFARASGEVLMILDADMTVPPEDLVPFFDAITSGRAEFVNGSRLVYTMEGRAMRFLNLVANKLFASAFSFLLEQRMKDTLCGTKVLLRSDYEKIAAQRHYFGRLDPFGDFDLLFGAARIGLRIRDLPIRYRDRTYGTTNISRFRHGALLLRMCTIALTRFKCR